MVCTRPIKLDETLVVPCGKCGACRKQRANEWSARLVHESAYHDETVFATLTYDDEHLPDPPDVSKGELQRFFKRLRRDLGERRIKYYACGEYGEKYGRPHYHAVIFGLRPCGACPSCRPGARGGAPVGGPGGRSPPEASDCELVRENWSFGHVDIDYFSPGAARYVTGYIEKALYTGASERARPFNVQSQGLGKRYVEEHGDRLLELGYDSVGGNKIKLPRYYQRKLEVSTEQKIEWNREEHERLLAHYMGKYPDWYGEDALNARKAHLAQSERNLKARLSQKERDYEA